MDNPQIAEHIAGLKNSTPDRRRHAARMLGEIGDTSAIPALIQVLKDKDRLVRWRAVDALGEIGDASAVPALIETLQDEDAFVHRKTADALGMIGPLAVPFLIEALTLKRVRVRRQVAEALGRIGNAQTLPRKILACSCWSAQERISLLERLRSVRYNEDGTTLHYAFPETRALCRTVLNDADEEACLGAQTVLNWLNGDRHLLRGSQCDPGKQAEELVRPVEGSEPDTRPNILLHASQAPQKAVASPPEKPTFWRRLCGKRDRGTH